MSARKPWRLPNGVRLLLLLLLLTPFNVDKNVIALALVGNVRNRPSIPNTMPSSVQYSTAASPFSVGTTVLLLFSSSPNSALDAGSDDAMEDSAARNEPPPLLSPPLPPPPQQHQQPNRFGDWTLPSLLLRMVFDHIQRITGRERYEFGDLSRHVDQRIKASIATSLGKGDYEFGDLTRLADQVAKQMVANYTGKESYQLGDITQTIVRKTWQGEYEVDDVWLCLKILLAAGVNLLPIAHLLPAQLLLELVDVALAQQVATRLLRILAQALDRRFKETLLDNADYHVGDFAKAQLNALATKWTGQAEFHAGDLLQAILARQQQQNQPSVKDKIAKDHQRQLLTSQVASDDVALLRDWDSKFARAQPMIETQT